MSASALETPSLEDNMFALLELLADEVRALHEAAAAFPYKSQAHMLVAELFKNRQTIWAQLEIYWTDPAVAAIANSRARSLSSETVIAVALHQDTCAAGQLSLFTDRVNNLFADILRVDNLLGEQRIALARAWDRYSAGEALIGRLRADTRPYATAANDHGLLPLPLGAVDSFARPA